MKIVTAGKYTDPFQGMKLTCERCDCTFELEGKRDVRRHHIEPDICWARCPTCGRDVTFRDLSPQ